MADVPATGLSEHADLPKEASPEELDLWMEARVFVGDDCPLTDIEADVEKVTLQQMRDTCRAHVVTNDPDTEILHIEKEIQDNSPAQVFHEHGTVPNITDADDKSITVTLFLDDREEAPKIVEDLQANGYELELLRLVDVNRNIVDDSTVRCDLSILTDKQREAVELATERGYYDRDQQTSLDSLADALGISKSALSRRLSTAEAKLVLELLRDSTTS